MPQFTGQELQEIHGACIGLWVLVQIDDYHGDMLVNPSNVIGASDLAVIKVLTSELAQNVDTALHD